MVSLASLLIKKEKIIEPFKLRPKHPEFKVVVVKRCMLPPSGRHNTKDIIA